MEQKKKRINDILSYLQEDIPEVADQPTAENADEDEDPASIPVDVNSTYAKRKKLKPRL